MTPAHMHMQVETLSSAGISPIVTVAAPGVHGVVVAGMHGCGVNTPNAAAVAAATCGFAGLMHMPNEAMFAIGAKSMMFAAGIFEQFTRFAGNTVSVEGATPKLQVRTAPETTCTGIASLP
jgi:predicted DNA repair protein MutK